MDTSLGQSCFAITRPLMESLEGRRLLSAAVPVAAVRPAHLPGTAPVTVVTAGTLLTGTAIHAEAGQAFRAVIGTIRGLPALPATYSLQGSINWGDGTAASAGQFVHMANGLIDVLGAHTYAAAGADLITVTVTAVPPAGSLAAVLLVGSFQSKASVITPDGGFTLNETAGVAFTADVGIFHSTLSELTMTALINWGDGTQSIGKISALPTAGLVPAFAVFGSHTYAATGSYAVHVTVYSLPPRTVTPIASAPLVILVAQIDTVIDVLPPLPTAV